MASAEFSKVSWKKKKNGFSLFFGYGNDLTAQQTVCFETGACSIENLICNSF